MKRLLGLSAGVALALSLSPPASALDGMSVELGRGNSADMGRVGLQWDWKQRWFQAGDWHLGAYWEASLGQWHRGGAQPGENEDITEIGLTPVFRVQPNGLAGPYGELGVGFHLLSHASIGERRLSTAFQFGDHIGFGYRFGAKDHFDLGYRLQHLSNASIKRPNSGVTFHQLRMQYHW